MRLDSSNLRPNSPGAWSCDAPTPADRSDGVGQTSRFGKRGGDESVAEHTGLELEQDAEGREGCEVELGGSHHSGSRCTFLLFV